MRNFTTALRPVLYSAALLCAIFVRAQAQEASPPSPVSKFYVEGQMAIGTYDGFGGGLGAKLVFNNKWSLAMSYVGMNMKPKNEPADYKPAEGIAVIIPYSDNVTADMHMVSLVAGKYFSLGRSIWATTGGGISFVSGDKLTYEPQAQVTTGIFPIAMATTSNYRTTKETASTVGLALDADINWAFASFLGLAIGAHTNLNSIQSPVWFDLKLLVGKMGRGDKYIHH
jgi:hypothetical protein